MTSQYGDLIDSEFATPLQRSKKYLEQLGINPSITDMFHTQYATPEWMNSAVPGASGFYDPDKKTIYLNQEYQQNEDIYLHELFHGLEDSLAPADKEELQKIMLENPPEGKAQAGFTNYPAGSPTQHHNLNSGWGLSSYIDYNHPKSNAVPYSEMFKDTAVNMDTSSDKFKLPDWWKMPKPVEDFLRKKFPKPENQWPSYEKNAPPPLPYGQ